MMYEVRYLGEYYRFEAESPFEAKEKLCAQLGNDDFTEMTTAPVDDIFDFDITQEEPNAEECEGTSEQEERSESGTVGEAKARDEHGSETTDSDRIRNGSPRNGECHSDSSPSVAPSKPIQEKFPWQ